MDKLAQNKVQPSVKKVKKKQGKDELDRIKQAEKKKRRLEKALAISAAIRTELELKKLKKKEEQQRLDEEGAAIAEAVALRVLIGEDSDDLCNLSLNSSNAFGPWICDRHFGSPTAVRRARSIMTQDSAEGIRWRKWGGLQVLKEPDFRKMIGHSTPRTTEPASTDNLLPTNTEAGQLQSCPRV